MGQCHAVLLVDRAVLRVKGEDARKFLQGLITSDINALADGGAAHAGLLNPQGKILFDFFVAAAGNGFLIDIAKDMAGELKQRLGFYRLRAAVEIVDETGWQVAATWGEHPHEPEGAIVYADPRLTELGYRLFLPADAELAMLGCAGAEEQDYHARRIRLGVPEGGRDYAFGDAFPHEALFDQLHGVDFTKGCFIGQEVVSRMEHRGTARKRILPVESSNPLPPPGTSVEAAGVAIGTLGSVHGKTGLALIRLDRAGEALARGAVLTAGDVKLTLRRPAFVRFEMPETISA
ncbi:MAG: folate-binding protein YgfZ [Alphaproteobacteria bacterium]|nr:folate-binding protein YgfZ [Alphaproteobacteria bacterium]